jgi:uncharacterized membrane protein YebE (DUF533 family)
MVATDKKITPEERSELDGLIIGVGFSPSDPEVRKVVDAELSRPGDLQAILKKIADRTLHAGLFRMLVEMACVDGEVALEERAKIAEAAAAFGFDRKAADELVSWTLESQALEQKEHGILSRLG